MVLVTCIFMGKHFPSGSMFLKVTARLAGQYTSDIKTLPNFIIAYLLTIWFFGLKDHHNKIINSLSKSTFAIYIVHQVPAFISFIWSRIFMADLWVLNHAAWYVFVVFTVLLAICSIVDLVRRKILQPVLEKSKIYKKSLAYINIFFRCN